MVHGEITSRITRWHKLMLFSKGRWPPPLPCMRWFVAIFSADFAIIVPRNQRDVLHATSSIVEMRLPILSTNCNPFPSHGVRRVR